MEMMGGAGVGAQCRKVDIVADAAYAILSQPTSYTGHFLVDEDVLREHGVRDFDSYAIQPGADANANANVTVTVDTNSSVWHQMIRKLLRRNVTEKKTEPVPKIIKKIN